MTNLQWIKEEKKYLLVNDKITLVEVIINTAGTSNFNIGSKQYQVTRKGVFSHVYIVQSNEEIILKLSHSFWGSNGRIVFNDQSVYSCDYRTKAGLKIVFRDGENEILSYSRSLQNNKVITSFSVGISMIDADKLLVMAALGFIMLQSLFREDSSDDGDTLLLMVAAS